MKPTTKWAVLAGVIASVVMLALGIIIGHFGIDSGSESDCPTNSQQTATNAPDANRITDDEVRRKMFDEIKSENIRTYLRELTNQSHPSGSVANEVVAEYIKNAFETFGVEQVHFTPYSVLLSRPNEDDPNTVTVHNSDGSVNTTLRNKENYTKKAFESSYLAYAAAGEVTSDTVVYANTAREQDFKRLIAEGREVNGSIVLARYGGFRGDQTLRVITTKARTLLIRAAAGLLGLAGTRSRRCWFSGLGTDFGQMGMVTVEIAAQFGAKAVLLFLDPSTVAPYGIDEASVYPNTHWMPGSAMERGSTYLGKGDPLTQGFVSDDDVNQYRTLMNESNLPKIPATPIGYADAQALFNLMSRANGTVPPQLWRPSNTTMNYRYGGKLLQNRNITVKVTSFPERRVIRNVIGSIRGCEEPDRYVILGNHYDAWTMGGIDPNSGTCVMLELARALGNLKRTSNWCPRRSIIIGAWDAEEYGLIGSTEWVEENLQILHERAVAYINIDAAVRGRIQFVAIGMPLLNQIIFSATKLVADPHPVEPGKAPLSVYEVWAAVQANASTAANETELKPATTTIGRLSAGSDYANFVNMVGVTSADIRYVGEKSNPAYHTAFETFEYVDRLIDPGFQYHAAMGKVWGEIIRNLADSVIIPFSLRDLAADISHSWNTLQQDIRNETYNFAQEINLQSLTDAIQFFSRVADKFADQLAEFQRSGIPANVSARQLNDRLVKIERMFLDPVGLPGRPLVRHILQAPSKANAYGSTNFAGIADSVAYVNEGIAQNDFEKKTLWLKELKMHYTKVVQMVRRAGRFLAGPLSAIDGHLSVSK